MVEIADITPTSQGVADIIPTFAVVDGQGAATFTATSTPSEPQAGRAAAAAATEVFGALGGTIPDPLADYARRVAAIRAAADLVLGLRGEDSQARQSLYQSLQERYTSALTALGAAVEAVTGTVPGDGGLDGGGGAFVGSPQHTFPDPEFALAFWD